MFEYSVINGFSIMNYVLAGTCALICLQPVDIIIKERQIRRVAKRVNTIQDENDSPSDTTTL